MPDPEQYYKLKKILAELRGIKGRHTELVTVYVPAGSNLIDTINQLRQEQGTAENIKSKGTRKNVTAALDKVIQHLRLYKNTPPNGLAVFSGNASEQEGAADIRIWAIEPPEPVKVKMYWCDQRFELAPLEEQVAEKELYGLVVLDTKEATIGLLKGKTLEVLWHKESIVPGKFIKGGQSAQRFERVREGLINDWYKEIAEAMKSHFSGKHLHGILLGGPGMSYHDFYNGGYLETDIRKAIIGMQSVGYTNEQGIEELLNRSADAIKEASVAKEKELVGRFLENLGKESGLAIYGVEKVLKALEAGSVDMILVSERAPIERAEYQCACGHSESRFVKPEEREKQTCPQGHVMGVIGSMDAFDALRELAANYGTKIQLISRESREGEQIYALGGVAAILRYRS